jgi:hypothetical protein
MQLHLNPELHHRAAALAAKENVSLNPWLSATAARAGGAADADSARAAIALAAFTSAENVSDMESRRPLVANELREIAATYEANRPKARSQP